MIKPWWLTLIELALRAFNAASAWVRSAKDIELGERRANERHAEINRRIRAAVERADPDSVSDDEAFGSGGPDDDLPGAPKG